MPGKNKEETVVQSRPQGMQKESITLGLVPAPDLAQEIAQVLRESLPALLSDYVNSQVNWEVELYTDPLTGATGDSVEILEETLQCKRWQDWDYAICVTDLPLFKAKRLIVADASPRNNVALISLPAFGATLMVRRVREAILQLTNEMYYGSSEEARDRQQKRLGALHPRYTQIRGKGARQLMGKRLLEWISPIRRFKPQKEGDEDDVRYYVRSVFGGGVRVLSGMVLANRPWSTFPAFKKVVVVAFSTGSYGLVFPTLWSLSHSYDLGRFLLLMMIATIAMVAWIILAHGLWEKSEQAHYPYLAKLYNAATALTLFISVLFYYAILFLLFFGAVLVYVPASLLEKELNSSVNLMSYVSLAWTACSIATIVGALGSALESEETVRNATYGYRQRRRYEEIEKIREREKGEE